MRTHPEDMQRYFVLNGQEEAGPFSLMQLRDMWGRGEVNGKNLFAVEGMLEWKPLGELKETVLKGRDREFIPMMLLCLDCGNEISFRANFCPVCGAPKI